MEQSLPKTQMEEQTVYAILTEWICEWQENVEVTPTAFLTFEEAQKVMDQMAYSAIQVFSTSPAVDRCDGYCELSSNGVYGTDCVKFSVVPMQIPDQTMEGCL